jgi:DNA helicase-2/ATP-dependent DNA helicase PcrA
MPADLLDELNDSQREAVTAPDGPLLILAGAGSGKTRVITHRIVHLIRDRGVPPRSIVAVTFTNKAAREMMERIAARLGLGPDLVPWAPGAPRLGTFHGFCLRLLRTEVQRLGYAPGFVIYDDDDSKGVVKECLRELQLDDRTYPPARILARLGDVKDRMLTPKQLLEQAGDHDTEVLGEIYTRYQRRLKRANAMDFDDLIFKTLELFRDHPDRRELHASRCLHLLVDEFQDTNASQYRLVKDLSSVSGNVLVVGDEDQSIYRFRGADIGNILSFENDFPGARLIRLERNYRSTKKILAAASAVVARNTERLGKTLFTDNEEGEPVRLFRVGTDRDEAAWLVDQIRSFRDQEGMPLEHQAVLYRANHQSRPFEELLTRRRIPYTIYGSVRFYERREVKDLLSYLRLLHNPDDDIALARVLNVPTRGIGRSSVEALERLRRQHGESLHSCIRLALEEKLLSPRQHASLSRFVEVVDDLRDGMKGQPIRSLLEEIMNRTGYLDYLERAEPLSFEDRVKNLEALAVAGDEAEHEGGDLQAFLDRTALTTTVESERGEGGVRLMTLHCAKGLEFPVVYVVGMEERLFPHARSVDTPSELEEERRLFYVGITRAMRRLLLSCAAMRPLYGQMQLTEPSRFLTEIPSELIEEETQPLSTLGSLFGGAHRRAGRRAGRARAGEDDLSTPAAGHRPAATGPVFSRGAGPRGEVTVEYDAGELPPEERFDLFRVGMEVIHAKYGRGTILRTEGSGPRLKLTVSFPGHGRKKFMASYAGLRLAP